MYFFSHIPLDMLSVALRCRIIGISSFTVFQFLLRLGKVVNKKKVQAEGFQKYFNKESGKLESNVVGLSEAVVKDGNKTVDGVRCSVYLNSFVQHFYVTRRDI